jgi:nitric oxide reductase subunit C
MSMAAAGVNARGWWRLGGLALLGAALVCVPARSLRAESEEARFLPDDPLAGRQIFIEKGCPKCHAIWGEGGSLGPDLGKVGVWRSVMELAGVLWNHSPAMIEKMRERRIARPTISTEEMANLAAFLYFLNYFDQPGDASKGEGLFSQKGCVKCHAVGGQGGNVGPALDSYKQFASPLFLARAMWTHNVAMARTMAGKDVPRPEFADGELTDIFAYIQEASSEPSNKRIYMVPGSPARGEKVFKDKGCVRCHAIRGAGGQIGPDLGREELHRSVTEIAGLMWNHEPRMWTKMQALGIPLPQFSNDELSDLIAYICFLQYFDPPGDVVKGQGLYMDKGCILCHYAPRGAEKRLAPDLSRSPALASPLALSSAMWNHAPAMEEQIRERGLPWPRFRKGEVRDLVEYLRSLRSAQH